MIKVVMKNNKGITLAVLVASVVILAILAFTVIGNISGENGLFSKTHNVTEMFNNEINNQTDMLSQIANGNYEPLNSKYYIRFNSNGGSGTMADLPMTYGVSANLPANTFTNGNFIFTGWNTEIDGSGTWFTDEKLVSNLTRTQGDIINLYAQWAITVKYAVQIYGINQDVDANDNTLGLTFGPATGDNYNDKYVTHRYEETSSGSGVYNVIIKTTTVAANGSETTSEEYLYKDGGTTEKVTITQAQYDARKDINLHTMTWAQIAAVSDKTVFEDCMLCGDTKSVTLNLNSVIASGNSYNQYGDGAGRLFNTIKHIEGAYYKNWNPSQSQNSYVGTGVTLDSDEQGFASNAQNAGGYSSSHIRATLVGENTKTNKSYAGNVNLTINTCLYSCIESDLQNAIEAKKIKYVTGTSISDYTLNYDIADKIWLFSAREVCGKGGFFSELTIEGIGINGVAYDKFTNTKSKYYIQDGPHNNETDYRKAYSEAGGDGMWWLRSLFLSSTFGTYYVSTNGSMNNYSHVYFYNNGLCFGFCI